MITGFNTDVEHNGVVYHVQTEDKGLETPFLLTLVYQGGTILARKHQSYEDLFEHGFNEKDLEVRLNRQHSLVCAAVNAGRIEELIALTKKEGGKLPRKAKADASKKDVPDVQAQSGIPKPDDSGQLQPSIPKPPADTPLVTQSESEPVVEVVSVIDDEIELSTEAVAIISDMAGRERPSHNRLCVEFINETPFKSGEHRTITFMVCRGSDRKVVGNAQIMVKILGSSLRPQIFHSVTDQNGLAKMELEFPSFTAGRAAFLVRASVAGEETEIRRAISST